jgi:hypothetical protein
MNNPFALFNFTTETQRFAARTSPYARIATEEQAVVIACYVLPVLVQKSIGSTMKKLIELFIVFLTAAALAPAQLPSQASGRQPISGFEAGVNGNGVLAKVIGGRIYTSTDNHSWLERRLGARTFFRDLTYANGKFVAVGGSYIDQRGVIASSTDGIHWQPENAPVPIVLHSIAWGQGLFVAVGDEGAILTSADGSAWKSQRSGTAFTLARVASGNGVFVGGGELGTIVTSSNGVTWIVTNLGLPAFLGAIDFNGSDFVIKANGHMFTSTNGLNWQPQAAIARNR